MTTSHCAPTPARRDASARRAPRLALRLRTLRAVAAAIAPLSAVVALSGCVAPGDFEALDQTCDSPRFDSPVRDRYCSGTWESRPIDVDDDAFIPEGRTFIQAQGDLLTALQARPDSDVLSVRVFRRDASGAYSQRIGKYDVDLSGSSSEARALLETPLLSAALVGAPPDAADLDQAQPLLAVVGGTADGAGRLAFLRLSDGLAPAPGVNNGQTEPFNNGSPEPTPDEPVTPDDPVVLLDQQPLEALRRYDDLGDVTQVARCDMQRLNEDAPLPDPGDTFDPNDPSNPTRWTPGNIRIRSVASYTSPNDTSRAFTLIAADCMVVAYGYHPQEMARPEPLLQLPVNALDVAILEPDLAQERPGRVAIAAGLEGLAVRNLGELGAELDCAYQTALKRGCRGGAEDEVTTNHNNTPDAQNNGFAVGADSFSPGLTDITPKQANPGQDAPIYITQVATSGDQVFYLNAPVGADVAASANDPRNLTYLFAADVSDEGNLLDAYSVAIANDDLEHDAVQWKLISLGDDAPFFAVLRNTFDTVGTGQIAINSAIKLFDAPDGYRPHGVYDIPLAKPVTDVFEQSGDLWIVFDDEITAYDFSISGAPLR